MLVAFGTIIRYESIGSSSILQTFPESCILVLSVDTDPASLHFQGGASLLEARFVFSVHPASTLVGSPGCEENLGMNYGDICFPALGAPFYEIIS